MSATIWMDATIARRSRASGVCRVSRTKPVSSDPRTRRDDGRVVTDHLLGQTQVGVQQR